MAFDMLAASIYFGSRTPNSPSTRNPGPWTLEVRPCEAPGRGTPSESKCLFLLLLSASSRLDYRGTSLIRKRHPVGPYSRTMTGVLGGGWGMGVFLWARFPFSLDRALKVCDPHTFQAQFSLPKLTAVCREARPFIGAFL